MPRRVTVLMEYPQHQHIPPRYPVVDGMANAVGTPDVCLHETEIPPHCRIPFKAVEMLNQGLVVAFGFGFTELLKGIHVNISNILFSILAQVKTLPVLGYGSRSCSYG